MHRLMYLFHISISGFNSIVNLKKIIKSCKNALRAIFTYIFSKQTSPLIEMTIEKLFHYILILKKVECMSFKFWSPSRESAAIGFRSESNPPKKTDSELNHIKRQIPV